MAKRKKKQRKAVYFPREPEWTVAGRIKKLGRRRLLRILGAAYDLLKTDPRDHQLAALAIGLDNSTWLFALDMGLGKTKIGIDIHTVRKAMGDVRQTLVVCPPIVIRHWGKEVTKHSHSNYALCEGKGAEAPRQKFHVFMHSNAEFVVVSNLWLTRLLGEALTGKVDYDEVVAAVARFDMVIIDEAHTLKNPESKGFDGAVEFLSDIPFCYMLTGTPVGNDYSGAWALYYLLDFGKTYLADFGDFLKHWFYVFLVGGRWPIYRLKDMMKDDFFDRFWRLAIRWEESECNDLPESTFTVLPVGMTKKQGKLYDAAINAGPGDDDEKSRWNLMRITGGVHEELAKEKVPSAKLEALGYIVQEVVVEREDWLVVWHFLNLEGALIAKYLRETFGIAVGEARGGISSAKKNKALEDWAAGKIKVIVANPGSIGIGIDLYEARAAAYYSNGDKLIDRKQSAKRIHRTGQTRHCMYWDLTCEGTVDEVVLANLGVKQDAFADLTRDQSWDKLRKMRKEITG